MDSDDGRPLCPVCCEELDAADRNFIPCKCGFQVYLIQLALFITVLDMHVVLAEDQRRCDWEGALSSL